MVEALRRALAGASRRRVFFFYIATFLVSISLLRGDTWKAIAAKIVFVAIGFFFVFLFELYKGWRFVAAKPWLNSMQLWKRFFIAIGVVSAAYVFLAIYLAIFYSNPDGLSLLFPFYVFFIVSVALPFFWEIKELHAIENKGE